MGLGLAGFILKKRNLRKEIQEVRTSHLDLLTPGCHEMLA
jgi:hypothetical protein